MPLRTHFRLTLAFVCVALAVACGKTPELDVQVTGSPSTAPTPGVQVASPSLALPSQRIPVAPGVPMPASHPPIDMAAGRAGPVPAPGGPGLPLASAGGEGQNAIVWTAPKSWVAVPPSNGLRRAQYRAPGPGGDSECVVFYFGPGQGGDATSNIQRWASQFEQPDGKPAGPAPSRTFTVGGMRVILTEASGTYLSGAMAGQPVEKRTGWALLGGVVEGPDANWYFKVTGPAATVEAQRAAFQKMLESIKARG